MLFYYLINFVNKIMWLFYTKCNIFYSQIFLRSIQFIHICSYYTLFRNIKCIKCICPNLENIYLFYFSYLNNILKAYFWVELNKYCTSKKMMWYNSFYTKRVTDTSVTKIFNERKASSYYFIKSLHDTEPFRSEDHPLLSHRPCFYA